MNEIETPFAQINPISVDGSDSSCSISSRSAVTSNAETIFLYLANAFSFNKTPKEVTILPM